MLLNLQAQYLRLLMTFGGKLDFTKYLFFKNILVMTFDGKLGFYELWWNILFFKKTLIRGLFLPPGKKFTCRDCHIVEV